MRIAFGSLAAAKAMSGRAMDALGVKAPIVSMKQEERVLYAVELPELSAGQWKELRQWKADNGDKT